MYNRNMYIDFVSELVFTVDISYGGMLAAFWDNIYVGDERTTGPSSLGFFRKSSIL